MQTERGASTSIVNRRTDALVKISNAKKMKILTPDDVFRNLRRELLIKTVDKVLKSEEDRSLLRDFSVNLHEMNAMRDKFHAANE